MPVVHLGNAAVREVIGADHDGAPIHRRHRGQSTVDMYLPSDEERWTHDERVRTATHPDGHWSQLSSQPPAWVACEEDPALESALAEHWGCPKGRPDGWFDHIEEI